jgi:hypothetical protein
MLPTSLILKLHFDFRDAALRQFFGDVNFAALGAFENVGGETVSKVTQVGFCRNQFLLAFVADDGLGLCHGSLLVYTHAVTVGIEEFKAAFHGSIFSPIGHVADL